MADAVQRNDDPVGPPHHSRQQAQAHFTPAIMVQERAAGVGNSLGRDPNTGRSAPS